MARDITSAFNIAIKSTNVKPIFAIELDISDGTLRLWGGYGELIMTAGGSSKTFTGTGVSFRIYWYSRSIYFANVRYYCIFKWN